MRTPTGSILTACALSVALLVAGCVRPGVKEARMGEAVYLLPATAQGPDPFTGSTVTAAAAPTGPGAEHADPSASPGTGRADPTASRTPGAGTSGPPVADPSRSALPVALVALPPHAVRALSGATPGLYGGTAGVAGCDVERQIGYLAADRSRGEAFTRAAGVSVDGLRRYLHGLTPVVLRADTRVTSQGYRDGRVLAHQAVLQAGTAVLVDDRGVPRVRCACGNPLAAPAPTHGGFGAGGSAWSDYRPGQVIAVTPAPRAVTSLTIVDAHARTWVERRIGHDVRHDQVVPAPATGDPAATATGTAPPGTSPPAARPADRVPSPGPTGTPPGAATWAPPDRPAGRGASPPGTSGVLRPSPPLTLRSDPPGVADPPRAVEPLDEITPPGTSDPADGGAPAPYDAPS